MSVQWARRPPTPVGQVRPGEILQPMPDNPVHGDPHFMLLHRWWAKICGGGVSSLLGCHRPATGSPCSNSPNARCSSVAPPHPSSKERPLLPVRRTLNSRARLARHHVFCAKCDCWGNVPPLHSGHMVPTSLRPLYCIRRSPLSPPTLLFISLSPGAMDPPLLSPHSALTFPPLCHATPTPQASAALSTAAIPVNTASFVRRTRLTCSLRTSPLPLVSPGPIYPGLPHRLDFRTHPFDR